MAFDCLYIAITQRHRVLSARSYQHCIYLHTRHGVGSSYTYLLLQQVRHFVAPNTRFASHPTICDSAYLLVVVNSAASVHNRSRYRFSGSPWGSLDAGRSGINMGTVFLLLPGCPDMATETATPLACRSIAYGMRTSIIDSRGRRRWRKAANGREPLGVFAFNSTDRHASFAFFSYFKLIPTWPLAQRWYLVLAVPCSTLLASAS